MKNIRKIFDTNPSSYRKIKIERGVAVLQLYEKFFSGNSILKIINFVNSLHAKYKNVHVPIVFDFGRVILADKLSYILLECICYSLIVDFKHSVIVYWKPEKAILTDGVSYSPLKLINTKNKESKAKYPEKFRKDIYKKHYRKVVGGINLNNTNYLGELYEELEYFLKAFEIEKEYRDQISEVISELVGNACEHGEGECLIDIDVTDDYLKSVKNIEQDGSFYGINITIVNFSDKLLGNGIKNKMLMENLPERYNELKEVFSYHKENFNENYKEKDFYNIAALQDKISGRDNCGPSGGTGLTKLIHSLQEKSDMDSCYVLSGQRGIRFEKDFLEYDDNGWLGLNKERDFRKAIPDRKIVPECFIYFPGTAYNLNFVMKREEE